MCVDSLTYTTPRAQTHTFTGKTSASFVFVTWNKKAAAGVLSENPNREDIAAVQR